jgi:hypothetical protein
MDGQKYDQHKPEIGLISSRAIEEEAKVMTFGKTKYGANNWRKGLLWSRCINALLRHTLAYNTGETNDPETGLSHMAHVRCCAAFLLTYEKEHPELDDRYNHDTVPTIRDLPCGCYEDADYKIYEHRDCTKHGVEKW